MKAFISFFLPAGLIFALWAVLTHRFEIPPSFHPFLFVFPYLVFGTGLFIGWRFDRGRLVYAFFVLSSCKLALSLVSAGVAGLFVFEVVAVLLPLNIAGVFLWKERGLSVGQGLFGMTALLFQVIGSAWMYQYRYAEASMWLEKNWLLWPFLQKTVVPQSALLLFVLAFIVGIWRFCRDPSALEGSFFWSLAASFCALHFYQLHHLQTLYFVAGGIILLAGVVETSHFMAFRDDLTKLPSRRALDEALLRLGKRYCVAMVDIDHFKKFNDTYGHDVGDQVLKMVASRISSVGGGGKAFRYGGEEFAIIFPRRSAEDILEVLEVVREKVASADFILRGADRPARKPKGNRPEAGRKQKLNVTVSIGVAERDRKNTTSEAVIRAADQALYRAKKSGRNKVCR